MLQDFRFAIVRRSVWDKQRFGEDLESAEDKVWTKDVLSLGYSIKS